MESEIRNGVLGRWGTLSDDEVKHAAQLVNRLSLTVLKPCGSTFRIHGTLRGRR